MRKKQRYVYLLLTAIIFIINAQSCKKNTTNDTPEPDEISEDSSGAPNLPVTLYDYVSTGINIPSYLKTLIANNPGIDNTPAGNTITNEGATLGRVLFYDKLLSANNTISCASCHHQDKAFTDGVVFSAGFEGGLTRRNSMPVINTRFFKAGSMFWDMRAANLETQTLMPILDHIEMGMPTLTALESKLALTAYYPDLFKAAFGTPDITSEKIGKALSQFLRSIVSFNSRYDQGVANNFVDFTDEEKEGRRILSANFCTECHSDLATSRVGLNASYLVLENSGINTGFGSNNGLEEVYTDKGIGEITQQTKDMGTFKIPSLRNVELTAPYMHDGRFATLEDAIEHYSSGIKQNPNIGIQLRGLKTGGIHFTDKQKKEIIAFLKTLTDHSLVTDPKYADPFAN